MKRRGSWKVEVQCDGEKVCEAFLSFDDAICAALDAVTEQVELGQRGSVELRGPRGQELKLELRPL